MRRKNRPGSDTFLGRDIRDYSHRHCFHHSICSTIGSIYTLQYNSTIDRGHFATVSRLFYKTPIVDCVQCPDTACADTVIQYCNVLQGSLRAYRWSDWAVLTRDCSRLRGDSGRRGETGYRSLGCLHLMTGIEESIGFLQWRARELCFVEWIRYKNS